MMMKGPTRAILPIGRQTVSVALPAGRSIASARLLVADNAVDVRMQDGRAVIEVPAIALLEVLRVRWA
jgi:hypothetical protein